MGAHEVERIAQRAALKLGPQSTHEAAVRVVGQPLREVVEAPAVAHRAAVAVALLGEATGEAGVGRVGGLCAAGQGQGGFDERHAVEPIEPSDERLGRRLVERAREVRSTPKV